MDAKYQKIIKNSHWEPKTRPRMPRQARAAQFAPFAALNGFYDRIEATTTQILAKKEREIVQESEIWPGDREDFLESQENPENL